MFSKATRPLEPGPARKPLPSAAPVVASLIASGVTVRGELTTEGELHLDGEVEGDVFAGRLTLGESGSIHGVVTADVVEIRGRIVGAVNARQVRLHATARVEGDIRHVELSMEAGAQFEGRSRLQAPAATEPVLIAAAE